MQALRQPGMRERHWQQLSEQLGMALKPDKDFVLSKALDMRLMDHLDAIQKVASQHIFCLVFTWSQAVFNGDALQVLHRGSLSGL